MFGHFELRPYQKDAITNIRDSYRAGNRAPLFVLPTGGGKTFTFGHVTGIMQRNDKRVWILTHRENLLMQLHEDINKLGIDHGLIASGRTPLDRQVQIASVHTLARRLDMHCPDLIIIDEAHHVRASTWVKIIEAYKKSRLLGVTATPTRLDGSGLGIGAGGCFDDMIQGPTVRELIDWKYLSPFDYYGPPAGVDLSNVGTVAGDFNRKQLHATMDKPTITGCAVEHYKTIADGEPAIAFCVSIEHAENVATMFRQAGYSATALHSKMSRENIKNAIKGLANGNIQIITSCDIISEGTDIPVCTTAILLRPTHSLVVYLQQVGRSLRYLPGKTAKILDHVGNIRHGFPDDDREWSLDSKKKKAKKGESEIVSPSRTCQSCYYVHRPQPTCPRCGHVYKTKEREIRMVDGTLQKLSKEEKQKIKNKIKYDRMRERGRAQTLEDLKELGRRKGYGQGWAYAVWKGRQKKQQESANV